MKNIKRIISIIAVLMLCLSTVSFATLSPTTTYVMEGKLSADSVKAGDTLTYSIYFYAEGGADVTLNAHSTAYIKSVFICPDIFENVTKDVTDNYTELGNGMAYAGNAYWGGEIKNPSTAKTLSATTPFITFTLTAKEAAEDLKSKFSFESTMCGANDNTGVPNLTYKTSVAAPDKADPTGGEAVKVAVAQKVGLGKYAAKQFDITNTDLVPVYGFTSTFKPVYVGTTEAADKPITRAFYFAATEGINAASFKFNAAIADIVTETEVVEVEISAAPILTAKQ